MLEAWSKTRLRRFAGEVARFDAAFSLLLGIWSGRVLWVIWPIGTWLISFAIFVWARKRLRMHASGTLEWHILVGFMTLEILYLARIFPQVLIR